MLETIIVWGFIIGFFMLAAYVTADDNYNTKAHKDLQETILNRNEEI
jgi:hypothetical protein